MTNESWQSLGGTSPTELVDARLVIHWAGQIVGAAGSSRVPAKPDFSHTNLGWSDAHDALVTHPMGEPGLVAGLRPATLELVVASKDEVLVAKPLTGLGLIEALRWLEGALDERIGRSKLGMLDHEMPAHDVGNGARFPAASSDAYAEVARWFRGAHDVISAVESASGTAASSTRCWPHHFDLATLITVEKNDDPEKARTIGVGMTPGDAGYPQPYFYVTPWPYPKDATLPQLAAGQWHTEGWTGAVLTGSDLVAAEDQHKCAEKFLAGAVEACRGLTRSA